MSLDGSDKKRATTINAKAKAFNPRAKTFNPKAKTFNPRGLKRDAASKSSFNPSAQAFNPSRGSSRASSSAATTQDTKAPAATTTATTIPTPQTAPFHHHQQQQYSMEGGGKGSYYVGQQMGGSGMQGMHEMYAPSGPPASSLSQHQQQQLAATWNMQQQAMGSGMGAAQLQQHQAAAAAHVGGYHHQAPPHHPRHPAVGPGMPSSMMPTYSEPMGMAQMDGYDWEAEREEQKKILLPLRRPVQSFFMPPALAEEYENQNRLLTARLQPEDREFYRLPITVDHERYHSLWPLPPEYDAMPTKYSSYFYKVTSTKDGLHYVLRRFVCSNSEDYAAKAIAPWIRIQRLSNGCHPSIIPVRTVFESQDFDEGKCLCFIYDYYPSGVPIATQYSIQRDESRGDSKRFFARAGRVIPEQHLWSFLTQLLTALVTIHPQGLAAMSINPYRVLVQSNRVRLNFCGINEALQLVPADKSVAELQFEDLRNACQLMMSIACGCDINTKPLEKMAFEQVMKNRYSADFCGILKFVLFTQHAKEKLPTVWDVQSLAWHKLVNELQQSYAHIDYLENQLAKEHQNGRLFSLISKLGFITERPEHRNDPKWSETGDRYLVKLFRDSVFHSVDEGGRPQIDLGHVINCLNKLDAASVEKTLLTSRNQDSLLVVSYKELNRCVRSAFEELLRASESKTATS